MAQEEEQTLPVPDNSSRSRGGGSGKSSPRSHRSSRSRSDRDGKEKSRSRGGSVPSSPGALQSGGSSSRSSRSRSDAKEKARSRSGSVPSSPGAFQSDKHSSRSSRSKSDRYATEKSRSRGGSVPMSPGAHRSNDSSASGSSRSRLEAKKAKTSSRSNSAHGSGHRDAKEKARRKNGGESSSPGAVSESTHVDTAGRKTARHKNKMKGKSTVESEISVTVSEKAATNELELEAVAVGEEENEQLKNAQKQIDRLQREMNLMANQIDNSSNNNNNAAANENDENIGDISRAGGEDGSGSKSHRKKICIAILLLLAISGGVVAWFLLSSKAEPMAVDYGAPTDDVLGPPSDSDCIAIANGNSVEGQQLLEKRQYELEFDNSLVFMMDQEFWLDPFAKALQSIFAPALAGCPLNANRQLRSDASRRLQLPEYAVANGIVENAAVRPGTSCMDERASSSLCFRVRISLDLWLRDAANLEDFIIVGYLRSKLEDPIANTLGLESILSSVVFITGRPHDDDPSTSPSSTPPSSIPPLDIESEPSTSPSALDPSTSPSSTPSSIPSHMPSLVPSEVPSMPRSQGPTAQPVIDASAEPTLIPSSAPTQMPSAAATPLPSKTPTDAPTQQPSRTPTAKPTPSPTALPTLVPSKGPTSLPSLAPTTFDGVKYGDMYSLRLDSSSADRWLMLIFDDSWQSIDVSWVPETVNIPVGSDDRARKFVFRSVAVPGGVEIADPKLGDCVRYGDLILLDSSMSSLGLTLYVSGGRSDGTLTLAHDYTDPYYSAFSSLRGINDSFWWRIRSEPGNGQWDDPDPSNACVGYDDEFYLQVANGPNRWLNGERDSTASGVYTQNLYDEPVSKLWTYKWQIPREEPDTFALINEYSVASQSSTFDSWSASKAIDGNFDPSNDGESVSHTAYSDTSPWWRVDLNLPMFTVFVTKVRITNRDGGYQTVRMDRLIGATVALLDANDNILQSEQITTGQLNYVFEYAGGIAGVYAVKISKPTANLHLAEVEVLGYGISRLE